MKSKILSLFLLTAILSIVMVNAAANFTVSTTNIQLTKSVNPASFTITNTAAGTITITIPDFSNIADSDDHTIILTTAVTGTGVTDNGNGTYDIPATNTATVTVSHSLTDLELEDLELGTFSESITLIEGTDNLPVTLNFLSGFCSIGEQENTIEDRTLIINSIKDETSEEEWEWSPLNKIDIEIKTELHNPTDDEDEVDAIIKIGLYDTEENEFIDLGDDDELERSVTLEEGEKLTETFTITVPVEDIEDSNDRYKLYVKVYEEDEEETLCIDNVDGDEYYQPIKISKESYEVILTDITSTSPAPCDKEAEITATVSNIGSNDEDKVQVTLYNKELGIDREQTLESLDEGESKTVSFTFMIPKGTAEKNYVFELHTSYKYKDSSESYKETSDAYTIPLKLEGNCKIDKLDVQITAELDQATPKAVAGKQVAIKATVKNTGDVKTDYTVLVYGNSLWSNLVATDPQMVSLEPGESKNVNIILNVNEDAEGEKDLTIKAIYSENSKEQKIALTIVKPADEGFFSGLTGLTTGSAITDHIKANSFLYTIGLINLVLIIAIISVVKRSGKKTAETSTDF